MLQNFRFTRYRFTYTVQEPLKMPKRTGNIFRSRFGYILRYIACIGNENECEKTCQHPNKCVYSRCFETLVPKDSHILRGQPYAPHPFVLQPPRTGKSDYAPGDTFTCDITLIGEAINILPWVVLTFHEMGKRRIGLQGKRGQCRLEKVESLSAYGHEQTETIFTAETEMLTGEGLILKLDDVMQTTPINANKIELEFLTPTSILVSICISDIIRHSGLDSIV